MKEQTLVIIKSDGVARGLIGEIVGRLEKVGLKLVGAKLVVADRPLAEKHYPAHREEFIRGMGQKSLDNYRALRVDPKQELGTEDALEIGKMIRGWLVEYLTAGPVFAALVEGPHAVELVRKICGHTLPLNAAPGTIRGDLAYDSSYLANTAKRAIKNLIHASGSPEEARYEIPLWFVPSEIHSYQRIEDKAMA